MPLTPTRMRSRRVPRARAPAALLAVLALAACVDMKSGQAAAAPPPTVYVADVVRRSVPEYAEYVGQTDAPENVDVRARTEGFIEQVRFVEGATVQRGQVLFVLDPRSYRERLAETQGQVASIRAQLAKARSDVARYKPLAEMRAIPRQDYDAAMANRDALEAQEQAAQAAMRQAQLDVGYATIHAPVTGRIGSSYKRVGDFVGRGEPTLLATISTGDSILVNIALPEAEYLNAVRVLQAENRRPGEGEPGLELVLADGSVHPHKGHVIFADRRVDPATGTLRIRASFPNPTGVIKGGQFGRVRAKVKETSDALLIPARAVVTIQGSTNVYVIGADGKAAFRKVKLGTTVGDDRVVLEGVQPGEKVVVDGAQKVRDGLPVKALPVPAGGAPADSAAATKAGA